MEGEAAVAAAAEELERRSKFLNTLIQRKKAVEQQKHCSGVRLRACDMLAAFQDAAFRLSREILDSMHDGKLDSKRLALTLKKEFDCSYGPAWHCIVGLLVLLYCLGFHPSVQEYCRTFRPLMMPCDPK